MKKNNIYLTAIAALFFGISSSCFAQQPDSIQWAICYGSSGDDETYCLQRTNDGGYIIAGWTGSDDGELQDFMGCMIIGS